MCVYIGFGCDNGAVVNILAHRDAAQRSLIQREYKAMYHKDLIKHLKSELSGNLEVNIFVYFQFNLMSRIKIIE